MVSLSLGVCAWLLLEEKALGLLCSAGAVGCSGGLGSYLSPAEIGVAGLLSPSPALNYIVTNSFAHTQPCLDTKFIVVVCLIFCFGLSYSCLSPPVRFSIIL